MPKSQRVGPKQPLLTIMKLSKIILTGLASALVVLSSCSKSNEDLIVGTWKVADMKIKDFDPASLPAEQKAAFEKQMKETKDNSSFEAKSDGSYHNVNWVGEKLESNGKWKFIGDGKSLVLSDGPRVDTVTVVTLTDSKMEWDIKGNVISYTK
jgi:hypothetical protein